MPDGIIIQARMGSSRLPGKSLIEINGQTLIERCFQQCQKSTFKDRIVFAIPDTPLDDRLEEFLKKRKLPYFRGSHDNLIQRYFDAGKQFNFENIIRLTGDNPVVCPEVIEKVYTKHCEAKADYTSTRHWDGSRLTGLYPAGLSVDIFNINSLETMLMGNLREEEKEHIVYYFLFRYKELHLEEVFPDTPLNYSFTVDTQEDLERVSKLINHFESSGIEFSYQNFLDYLG